MTYQDQLLTPEWKAKRQEIIDRDWGHCTCCMSTKNLQVHHNKYISGLKAWEHPNEYLVTLCSDCHTLEHNLVPERQPTKHIRTVMYEFINSLRNLGKK